MSSMALAETARSFERNGRIAGRRDSVPVALRNPVEEGEGLISYYQVIGNLRKPEGMEEDEWKVRKGVVEILDELAGDEGMVIPLNKLKNTAYGKEVAGKFRVVPVDADGKISPIYQFEYSPSWDMAIVESVQGIRTQISIDRLLRARSEFALLHAQKAFRAEVRSAAVKSPEPRQSSSAVTLKPLSNEVLRVM